MSRSIGFVPKLVLAPMEGITDAPMRETLVRACGADFAVTEFLRVSQQPAPKHVIEAKVGAFKDLGVPLALQILGGDAGLVAETAATAVELGIKHIDLNFGCPAPTVNRSDGGATLLKHPHRLREIVARTRAAVPPEVTVSAKLRLGWEDPADIVRNAPEAAAGGASWITIHARTRMQSYQPPVYWGRIGEVRKILGGGVPLIANGDIRSAGDLEACSEITGCESFMIGRGWLANPYFLRPTTTDRAMTPERWLTLFDRLSERCRVTYGRGRDARGLLPRLKQWLGYGARGGESVAMAAFPRAKTAQTVEEFLSVIREISDGMPSRLGGPQ